MWNSAKVKPDEHGTANVLLLLTKDGRIVEGWYDKSSGNFYQFSSTPIHGEITDWKKK